MSPRHEPDFKERLLFTLLSAALLAVATVAAERAAHAAWRRATGRDVPKRLPIASSAAEKAGRAATEALIERVAAFI